MQDDQCCFILHLHKHSSCRPVRCLLQQTKSHTTPSISQAPIRDEARLLPVLLPTIRSTKVQMGWFWTTKSITRTQRRFSCYSKSQAKERSSDRPPAWRLLFCLKLCFRVIEKTFLCLCGAFSMLCELVHIEHSFWKGGHTCIFDCLWTTCTWYRHLFLSPFSLSLSLSLSLFSCQTDYKKKLKWSSAMDVQWLRIIFLFKIFQSSTLFY